VITGVEQAAKLPGATVFHAGTTLEGGRLVVSGGRVLNVSAVGSDLAEARDLAYRAAGLISFEGMQLRTDVGEPVRV
jgi:phosphoribosylamine---glycine ligase